MPESAQPLAPLSERLQHSPLMRKGGVDVYEGLLDSRTHLRMLEEAFESWNRAIAQDNRMPNPEEDRGGTPPRSFLSAGGGQFQEAFYRSGFVLDTLRQAIGLPVAPTGARATFSYYVRPGDFLDLHRDIRTCDLAVISLLHDDVPTQSDAGALCVYPDRHREPLSWIRKSLDRGAYSVKPRLGQTIVMFGGIVPHQVLPVKEGHHRITSVLCYRVQVE